MSGQMSIFDFIECNENSIEDMTSKQLAEIIGQAIGIDFKPSGWKDQYEFKIKKFKMTVRKSHYSCDTMINKEGDAFISCGYSYGIGGAGSPIDTIDGAIKFFRRFIKDYEVII